MQRLQLHIIIFILLLLQALHSQLNISDSNIISKIYFYCIGIFTVRIPYTETMIPSSEKNQIKKKLNTKWQFGTMKQSYIKRILFDWNSFMFYGIVFVFSLFSISRLWWNWKTGDEKKVLRWTKSGKNKIE